MSQFCRHEENRKRCVLYSNHIGGHDLQGYGSASVKAIVNREKVEERIAPTVKEAPKVVVVTVNNSPGLSSAENLEAAMGAAKKTEDQDKRDAAEKAQEGTFNTTPDIGVNVGTPVESDTES